MHSGLSVKRRGRIATLIVTRPPDNALNLALLESMAEELQCLADDAEVGVAVWRSGLPGVFSGGYDRPERPRPSRGQPFPIEPPSRVRRAQRALLDVPFPLVAAIDGAALGLGMLLPLQCDVVVAGSEARFGLARADLGSSAHATEPRRLLSEPVLRYLTQTGRRVPPEYLMQHGLIARVVDSERFDAEVQSVAEEIAAHDPVAVRNSKLALETLLRHAEPPESEGSGRLGATARRGAAPRRIG